MADMHLAQVNVARALYPIDTPQMSGFVGALDRMNALADAHEGFVWRWPGDADTAAPFHMWGDPRIIINMSVWRSIETLGRYAYETAHVKVFERREKWFEPLGRPALALWWIDVGTTPTVNEAQARLDALAANGPTAETFNFGSAFAADGTPINIQGAA